MGGGSQSQQSGPPDWMVPYIQDIITQGRNQYQNYTPQYYPNSTVAPQSRYTNSGIAGLGGYGNSPGNQAAVSGAQGSSATLQGASDPSQNAALGAGQAALPAGMQYLSGVQNAGPTNIQNLGNDTAANTSAAVNNQLTQRPGSNPYVDEMVQRALAANTQDFNRSVMPQLSNASQISGGYGGTRQGVAEGIAAGDLATANANAASSIYTNQYNQDQQRLLQAAGMGANIQQGASNATLGQNQQGLTATGMGMDLLNTGYTSGLDAAGRNLALSPTLQQMGTYGDNASMVAGGAQDAYQQALIQDQINRWNFTQDLPYNQLNQYASLVYGGSGPAGTQTTMSGGGSGALGAAAGGVTGAGAAAALTQMGTGQLASPWGWAMIGAGALLGYLGQR